jgi:Xaa-Pro dipeptidase
MKIDPLDSLYSQHLQLIASRTDAALAACGYDAMVVHSGAPPTQFLDDQDYPFKPNPHFKAWVPIVDNPHCALIYRPSKKPLILFHRPEDYWHKPADLPADGWTRFVDLEPIAAPGDARNRWSGIGRVALIGPVDAFTGADAAAVNPPELLAQLHFARAVKSPYEIECMRRASRLGAAGHRAALATFRSRGSEYEAHMDYLRACGQREEEMPYNNIVAFNEHAAVLHYQHLDRSPPAVFQSFLIDAGAQYRGYSCDITRSYAAESGSFADLVQAMEDAQLSLCALIKSGTDYRDVHLSAHRAVGDVLKSAGITALGGQDALESGLTSVFFPHGIGHLLGLQVHDVGGVMADAAGHERDRPAGHPYLRLTRMLEPGVVVTVEPGVYFIDMILKAANSDKRRDLINWTRVDALRPYGGIRIEDDVVTTAGAPENLTRDAFALCA